MSDDLKRFLDIAKGEPSGRQSDMDALGVGKPVQPLWDDARIQQTVDALPCTLHNDSLMVDQDHAVVVAKLIRDDLQARIAELERALAEALAAPPKNA